MSATESMEPIELVTDMTRMKMTPFKAESAAFSESFEQKAGKMEIPSGDLFFRNLVERAKYYEQFEDRRSKITCSGFNIQSEIGAF
ncbi:hypothetical protein [Methanolapillus ohkumae]|uniref:Uncharacterized protein n=1 Tax=Methanolapillus ohkumae TaxID=3028298 RepID=A0AA97A6E6_9EURY|nr:hypothetical protein MsAm2_10400 [Methanosarcinaceae archaeon Am2]